jgi:hypothetical protein
MALPITPKPTYPNIPNVPGSPTVLRQIAQAQNTAVLLVADAAAVLNLFGASQWGLFTQSGAPAFSAGSPGLAGAIINVLTGNALSLGSFEYRSDMQIATAPQEEGAFTSYNKVALPYQARVTYTVSGSSAQRAGFLAAVQAAEASLTLYTLASPEILYANCNIIHVDYRRTARSGVTMLSVDIWVEEVRVSGVAAFSNAASPGGSTTVNAGTVQPQVATPQQASAGAGVG